MSKCNNIIQNLTFRGAQQSLLLPVHFAIKNPNCVYYCVNAVYQCAICLAVDALVRV